MLLSFLMLTTGLVVTVLIILGLWLNPNHRLCSGLLFIIGLLCGLGSILWWHSPAEWQAPASIAIGLVPVALKVDTLALFFLLLLGILCVCCAIYSPKYLERLNDKINTRVYWIALFTFVMGMAGVILSANAPVFLVAWEIMSLSSAVLVVSEYRQRKAQHAAFIYLVATRLATVFLAAGFLLMYAGFNDWSFASWQFSTPKTWIAATCILLGLIIKAGCWPFHIWLPHAHPEAPAPVSALMSGLMVKIAIYAIIRLFILGNLDCQPLVYALFILSCISTFWGILFAINQPDLKRLLAYSTVENVGLILAGLALCIWAKRHGLPQVAQMALLASLLHTFGHALFKSLLFLCAGSVDYAVDSHKFAFLGGLTKNMPITGITFIVGSAAICALPPFNGFASKWCLYQALLQASFSMPALTDRAICISAIGILSAVGALVIACFAKAIGVAFLGRPRGTHSKYAHEVPLSMRLPQIALSLACLGMGIATPLFVQPLRRLISTAVGGQLITSPFTPIPLWQIAAALAAIMAAIYVLVLHKRPLIYKTWDCGFGATPEHSQVAADSFAQPIAKIFAPILRYDVKINISGRDRRHFPEHISAEPSMVSLLETKIYSPVASMISHLSKDVAKLQGGSIHLYLLYLCIAMVVFVLAGTYLW